MSQPGMTRFTRLLVILPWILVTALALAAMGSLSAVAAMETSSGPRTLSKTTVTQPLATLSARLWPFEG